VILHGLRAAASGDLASPTGSRIAHIALSLFVFALPATAHALNGTADAMVDIVIQAVDPGLAPAKPMIVCMADGSSLEDCAQKQLSAFSSAAKQEAVKQLPFDPYDSRIQEVFDLFGMVQKNDWLGVIDRAGSVAAKTMVCALLPPGVKTVGCPVTGYVIDHQKKVLADGYAALVKPDWPGLAQILLSSFSPDVVCTLLPSEQFGYLGAIKDIGCSLIGEILNAASDFAKSVVALGEQGADALEEAFFGDDSHMPYDKYFGLNWEPWYHYGTWLCVTQECAGLGDLNGSIKGPCVDYFDSHDQYRSTAKKTCGDMYGKFDRQVKEFAARMKVAAEIHVDTLWPVAQTLAVADYVKNQSQPKMFFQLNCETALIKQFPFPEPNEYTCEVTRSSFMKSLFLQPFAESFYKKCLANADKQWPSPTAWTAACAPAADRFQVLVQKEKDYLEERLGELVLGGCLIAGGNTGSEAIHLECTNYPVYQSCLAILSHGAEQQHCALNQAAADQKVMDTLMVQLGTKRCQVSGSDIVCRRPWKVDSCKAMLTQILGSSASLSQLQCKGDSIAVAAFVMAAKEAENTMSVLNGGLAEERESSNTQGGRRLEAPAAGSGRLCKQTWDPLAIDCRSKAPLAAHPEITLPACPPDPNQDGADTPCLVPRLFKSDSENLPGATVSEPAFVPGAAAAVSNAGMRETAGTSPSGAAVRLDDRQIGRMASGASVFEPPLSDGKRIDICLNWGSGCGQAAADAFCQTAGFARAADFTVAEDIGAESPTLVIGDGKLCTEAYCDGFAMIRCSQ